MGGTAEQSNWEEKNIKNVYNSLMNCSVCLRDLGSSRPQASQVNSTASIGYTVSTLGKMRLLK